MPMPAVRGAAYLAVIGIPPRETGRKESDAVFHPNQLRTGEPLPIAPSVPVGACLVAGCTCKDARILSTRRAAYFASIAASRGETAARHIAADDGWRLPTSPALEATRTLAAVDLAA
jgi:hypothetical protein